MGGEEKLLLQLGGKSVLDLILDRVRPQVDNIAINVRNSSRGQYEGRLARGTPLISDPFAGVCGPLGGVVAGLSWLSDLGAEYDWLATFPGDTPFLPRDLVSRLKSFRQPESPRPVVAFGSERVQSLCALWPKILLQDLCRGIWMGRSRSVRNALEEFSTIRVPLGSAHSFINLNTKRDLADAERLIKKQPQMLSANDTP